MSVAPTARRRQLGSWLRNLREMKELSPRDAAELIGYSESKIRHQEKGRSVVKADELRRLLDIYEASTEVREQLEALRPEASHRGWWESYRLPTWAAPFIAFESEAREMLTFEPTLVPGLLQTKEYAYEIHRAGRYLTNPPDIDARVNARMERQRRLAESTPLELRAVVTEEVLRRPVGGLSVMRDQLAHLVSMANQQNVLLQVLPLSAGAYACQSGSLTILRFDEGEDVAFLESPLGGHVVDERSEVDACRYLFDEVRASSMSTAQSIDLVRSIAEDIALQEQEKP
ncbi:helix-turn-helix transcriptional regulator [Saccharopolyspora gloriosae]|uniref:helix-turn-helix domain-containing protein n=1 Tax=Saccharopolyspora gloriosae TaxID=455344 RepID=UPI0021600A42|nr:helix-turn-helix transcriptional regulator [Saccharopolyspora gloriosae]